MSAIFVLLLVLPAGFLFVSECIVGRPNGTTDGRDGDA